MTRSLCGLIDELADDPTLAAPDGVLRRIDALDRLEVFLVDDGGPHAAPGPAGDADAHARAAALRARLEAADTEVFESIRRDIRRGAGAETLLPYAAGPRTDRTANPPDDEGYDALDVLVAEVLRFDIADTPVADMAPDMVPYQPTPVRHVFDLLGRLSLTERDVLVDLGSGLGQVPLLTAICTPASAVGVELEAAYVSSARRSAADLGLTRATFVRGDARDADLSSATVFYLYTPFTGAVMRAMLGSLRREADRREIRICTYGPCTPIVAGEPWLEPVRTLASDAIAILRSRP